MAHAAAELLDSDTKWSLAFCVEIVLNVELILAGT